MVKWFQLHELDENSSSKVSNFSTETTNSEISLSFRSFVKAHSRIELDSIKKAELLENYPQWTPIKPIHYKFEEVEEIIVGQDFYRAIKPVQ